MLFRSSQTNGQLLPLGLIAWGRLFGRQPFLQLGGGFCQGRLERALTGNVTLVPAQVAHRMGHLVGQRLPQPTRFLGIAAAR